jgi:hypothetical protein
MSEWFKSWWMIVVGLIAILIIANLLGKLPEAVAGIVVFGGFSLITSLLQLWRDKSDASKVGGASNPTLESSKIEPSSDEEKNPIRDFRPADLETRAKFELLLKYSDDVREGYKVVSSLPVGYQKKFVEQVCLSKVPEADVARISAELIAEHEKELNPFSNENANQLFRRLRQAEGQTAADEYRKVLEALGDGTSPEGVYEKVVANFAASKGPKHSAIPPPVAGQVKWGLLDFPNSHWWMIGLMLLLVLLFGALDMQAERRRSVFSFPTDEANASAGASDATRTVESLTRQLVEVAGAARAETENPAVIGRIDELLRDGQAALGRSDAAGARASLASLTGLRDQLVTTYSVNVINDENETSGVWREPANNPNTRNYYLIVEAVQPDGSHMSVRVINEETGVAETVKRWGVRVPESFFQAIRDDKMDNGSIEKNPVGIKERGELEPRYVFPKVGGAITSWDDK